MLGYKFNTGEAPSQYWGMNVYLPGALAERFRASRFVCFSTGNVYPWISPDAPMPTEETPCAPDGEYAVTAMGRERIVDFMSRRYDIPACLLRLNYAMELRYGVPVDIALLILARKPIDLSVPYVNCVWQGYANAVALAAFDHLQTPPRLLNLTGPGKIRVRDVALELGKRLGIEPTFLNDEGPTALLNDASRCHELFGPPDVELPELLDWIAAWLKEKGRTLGKPTKFQARGGKF